MIIWQSVQHCLSILVTWCSSWGYCIDQLSVNMENTNPLCLTIWGIIKMLYAWVKSVGTYICYTFEIYGTLVHASPPCIWAWWLVHVHLARTPHHVSQYCGILDKLGIFLMSWWMENYHIICCETCNGRSPKWAVFITLVTPFVPISHLTWHS